MTKDLMTIAWTETDVFAGRIVNSRSLGYFN